MNTLVKVRLLQNPPLTELTLTPGRPPRLFTRVWMAIVPPSLEEGSKQTESAYACVVGEVYDGDDRQKSRVKMILDEADCLHPDDLTKAGIDPEQFHDLVYTTMEDGKTIPKAQSVVMEDIRGAAVALKDLYRPRQCVTPAGPKFEGFHNWIRQTHGLMVPIPGEDRDKSKATFPFFRHASILCPVISDIPFWVDSEEYANQLINSLISRNELRWWKDTPLWQSPGLKNPRRAIGMICAGMSLNEWQYYAEAPHRPDGYEDMEDEAANAKRISKLRKQYQENFWMLS